MTPPYTGKLRIEQIVGIALVALLTIGTLYFLSPFLAGFLYAVILVVSTWRVFEWLRQRLKGSATAAAAIMILFFAALLLVPIVFLSVKVVDEVPPLVEAAKDMFANGLPPAPAWVAQLPLFGETAANRWNALAHDTQALGATLRPWIGKGGEVLLGLFANVGQTILQIIVSLLVAFFLYRDGAPLVRNLTAIVERVGGTRGPKLLQAAGSTMRAVVYGILGAAIVQGLLATFGLWLTGVQGWLFLGVAGGFLALIPLGLINLELLAVAAWLFYVGRTGWAVFLLLWTLIVVANADSVIRPAIISRGANLPISVVLLGVLGGLATGGILGLFVGATVVGVFFTMIRDWASEPPAVAIPEPTDPGANV
ncbi:MAG: AI-2E family transporter [Burkholderiales bacterium]|nr:AI-2E family transporter [Burkholderiales bacterium]